MNDVYIIDFHTMVHFHVQYMLLIQWQIQGGVVEFRRTPLLLQMCCPVANCEVSFTKTLQYTSYGTHYVATGSYTNFGNSQSKAAQSRSD